MARNKKPKKQGSKGGYRGNKTDRKIKAKEDQSNKAYAKDRGVEDESKSNAPSIWMGATQLAFDATNISTMGAAGAPYNSPRPEVDKWTPAGIMRLDYVPFFGNLTSPVDTLNIAARKLYDEINAKNSRNPSYDPQDLMIYVIAMANAWAMYSVVLRIVGMYTTFSPYNRYWYKSVLKTMGIADITTTEDIVTWRNLANRMALKLNMLAVPNNIEYFTRCFRLCAGIYKDAPLEKAGLFYYMPIQLMKYSYDDSIGMLENVDMPWRLPGSATTPYTVEDYFNDLVENLFNDSDINTMASDIIKAIGIENCYRLPLISEDYQIVPSYDPVVLMQTHNARISYSTYYRIMADDLPDYRIVQSPDYNCLVSENDTVTKTQPGSATIFNADYLLLLNDERHNQVMLDFPIDGPNNVDVMEATRLTWYSEISTGSDQYRIYSCTEVVVNDWIATFDNEDDAWTLKWGKGNFYIGLTSNASYLKQVLERIDWVSKFNDAPIRFMYYLEGQATDPTITTAIASDLDNYTVVSKDSLRKMNDAAIISAFIPHVYLNR